MLFMHAAWNETCICIFGLVIKKKKNQFGGSENDYDIIRDGIGLIF